MRVELFRERLIQIDNPFLHVMIPRVDLVPLDDLRDWDPGQLADLLDGAVDPEPEINLERIEEPAREPVLVGVGCGLLSASRRVPGCGFLFLSLPRRGRLAFALCHGSG